MVGEAITRKMSRTVVIASVVVGLLVTGSLGAWSAPTDMGEIIEATCDGTPLRFLRSNGSSGWGVDGGELDGSKYHLVHLDVYFEGEPVFSKSWGRRNGHGEPLSCTATLADPRFTWVFAITSH